ncbi:replication initiation protein RepC [Martelella mediterranea]|uniref:plasmid replication protein RepC n=1 Tax=Martelella mediterranea TaxID=293089 RepID=UPI001E3D548C|nr:plasmid replication protein RepC [Martelella mediterranea]MCD1634045.1 replication initiation protein RepC [Martelella mediterranea]
MDNAMTTTPFGRRPMSLAMLSSQKAAREAPKGARLNKWKLFHTVREARTALGASDRGLAILNALLTFYPENELSEETGFVVWPSNEQLIARANGISPATLRRHLAVLVECGLIIRRDSPNGKRFARKGRGGQVEQAYGFDLSPLVARAEEFAAMAETIAEERRALKCARERLTLLRRDIVKMIEAGLDEGVPGDWAKMGRVYRDIIDRLPRVPDLTIAEDICDALALLHEEVRETLENHVNLQNKNANESHAERHKQNSNPDSQYESEYGLRNKSETSGSGSAGDTDNLHSLPKREMPLALVLDACESWRDLAKGGSIRNWREFLGIAEIARPMLGVSPSAWREAAEVMGDKQAAITLAAIYQRGNEIISAGGYLRNLTERARDGQFSVWPMVMALLRARIEAGNAPQTPKPDDDGRGEGGRDHALSVSPALARSMKRPPR